MRYNLSAICKAANSFIKKGYTRRASFIMAWRLAKSTAAVKVAGVTYGDRQAQLAALSTVSPDAAAVELHRESGNKYDVNAVAVIINGHKAGYLPTRAAALISALIDAGQTIAARLKAITGGWAAGLSYGAQLEIAM